MKIEVVCPCCNEKFQVDTSVDTVNDNDKDILDKQAVLEQELLDKHSILLG